MAAQLPAKLRTAEIQRFATRAVQLEKFKPIVTYWCECYVLQQVINKNLHNTDEEVANYALHLMDKLEKTKSENASNDAIIDEVAAKAYVENFALETFNRAENAQRANAVTKQTADTFMAAATFLDLLSIWGAPDQEISSKSKFAKFHALRIAKAFKAGEDPNATNPVVEEQPAATADDGIETELKELEQQGREGGVYQPPTAEAAPGDDGVHQPPPVVAVPDDGAAHPLLPDTTPNDLAAPPLSPPPEAYQPDNQVSPIEPPESTVNRQNSIGGGYFPTLSSAPVDTAMSDHASLPAQTPQQPASPQHFYTSAPQHPTAPSISSPGITGPDLLPVPPPENATTIPTAIPPVQSPPMPSWQNPAPRPAPVVPNFPAQRPAPVGGYKTDDEAVMAAQKHARWAISALNFEDVNTAVKELRLALQSLGAG